MDNIIVQAAAATAFVKVIVDALKFYWPTIPGWVYLLCAAILSPFCLVASMVVLLPAGGVLVFDQPTMATVFLGSIMTFGSAVGVTEFAKRADAKRADATGGG